MMLPFISTILQVITLTNDKRTLPNPSIHMACFLGLGFAFTTFSRILAIKCKFNIEIR